MKRRTFLQTGAAFGVGCHRAFIPQASAQQRETEQERCLRLGREAILAANQAPNLGAQRARFREGRDWYVRAARLGDVDEAVLVAISFLSRHFLWEYEQSEAWAGYNAKRNPRSVPVAIELTKALGGVGKYVEARELLVRLAKLPQATLAGQDAELEAAKHRLATKIWQFTFHFATSDFQTPYPRRRFAEQGCFECFFTPDTPYQRTIYSVEAAATQEEVADEADNRTLRLVPLGDGTAVVTFTVQTQPYRFDLAAIGKGPYGLPEHVKPFLGRTVMADPFSPKMKAVGAAVQGADRADTIRRAVLWLDWNFHFAGPGAETTAFDAYFRAPGRQPSTDALLEHCTGHCWEYSRLLATILRACGIAARQRLVALLDKEGGRHDWFAGWHIIPEYYEPGYGWIPLEGGRELFPGVVPPLMIPVFGEQADQSNEMEDGHPWPLESVGKAWRLMWFGNKSPDDADSRGVDRTLVSESLDCPYPWTAER